MKKNKKSGFTLVEIMIVVLIIGLLAAIAIPSFINARTNARTKACINNLRQIASAKDQWAMETNAEETGTPDAAALGPYIKGTWPVCPLGSKVYVIGAVSADPTCPNGGTHVLP